MDIPGNYYSIRSDGEGGYEIFEVICGDAYFIYDTDSLTHAADYALTVSTKSGSGFPVVIESLS